MLDCSCQYESDINPEEQFFNLTSPRDSPPLNFCPSCKKERQKIIQMRMNIL